MAEEKMDPITEEYLDIINKWIIKDDEDCREGVRNGAGSDLYFQLEAINRETDPIIKTSLAIYTSNAHIFNCGNKRTAFALAEVILGEYGFYIDVEKKELIRFSCWVASIDPNVTSKEETIEVIINWIRPKIRELGL